MRTRQYYKITFYNQGSVYEISARYVSESQLFGFLEVSDLLWDDEQSNNPSKVYQDFAGVKTSYIPTHAVVRIDEVEDKSLALLSDNEDTAANNNVSQFPVNSAQEKKS